MIFTYAVLILSCLVIFYLGYKIKFEHRIDLINLNVKKEKVINSNELCEYVGNRLLVLGIFSVAMTFFLNSPVIVNVISIIILTATAYTLYDLYFSGKFFKK
jgi:hypothetical protein